MDELSRKFRSIDWKGLQKSARKVQASTASALKDMVMTDVENKVRAATSDTAWGASGSDLMQIAQGTFNREDYALIMSIVWQRLGSSRWRCVYKSLEVLRHLIMHGAARCAEEARAALHHLQTLTHYRYVDPKTRRDCGEGVRTRAKLVCDMLSDDAILEEEREKSKELRAKLQGGMSGPGGKLGGLSSDDYRYGHGSDGGYSSGVTTTSTGGAGNFKGYGDDDEGTGGGYDDMPTGGMFAKRPAAGSGMGSGADMPDLLGDDSTEQGQGSGEAPGFGGAEDDDDDDFDPRGGGSAGAAQTPLAPPTAGDDDLFGALALTTTGDGSGPAHAQVNGNGMNNTGAGALPTSVLIQNLARQKEQQGQLQVHPQATAGTQGTGGQAGGENGNGSGLFEQAGVQVGNGSNAGFGFGPTNNGGTATGREGFANGGATVGGQQGAAKAPKVVVSSKGDGDPFGDLLDNAKKTGVL